MKVLIIIGTRPEGIKLCPLVLELKKREGVESKVLISAQHRELLDSVLKNFGVEADYDLNIFKKGQSLSDIMTKALKGIEEVLQKEKFDLVLVQGDTSTVFAGALAAFYQGVSVGHVEAGLRTDNLYSPFPEEANRRLTGVISNYHFCPTLRNKENLLKEGYDESRIYITGNTVIDALIYTAEKQKEFKCEELKDLDLTKKIILLTSHRRENQGENMKNIFKAVRDALKDRDDVELVFPMHPNPKVREVAFEYLSNDKRIKLIEPIEYTDMARILKYSYLVITDSGGLQEEAPAMGVPVLVVREETERPEGIEGGTAILSGTSYDKIFRDINTLLDDKEAYEKMHKAINPYGDGTAARKIVDIILKNEVKK